MKRIALFVGALLVVCGCGVSPPATHNASNTAIVATQLQPPPPLLVDVDHDMLRVRPVDPQTLADLHTPISLGHHFTHAVSADTKHLAVIVWPSGANNREGVLHLIDRQRWTDQRLDVTFDDYVNVLRFTADGNALLWAKSTHIDPAHGMRRDFVLERYDLGTGIVTPVATFESSFMPLEAHVLRSEQLLAVYGVPTDANNLAESAPHLVLIDLARNTIAADLQLDGVQHGQRRLPTANTTRPGFELNTPGVAWDLAADLLYVAHANEDTITVGDLARQQIAKQQAIVPRQTGWERMLAGIFPSAHAAPVPGSHRQAVLSNDGTRLYVASTRHERRESGREGWPIRETPLGVQVIATNDLVLEQRLDLPVNTMALSPNGQHLLLWNAPPSSLDEPQSSGLFVFDTVQLEQRAHLQPEAIVVAQGFSPDSRYAYVSHQTNKAEQSTVVLSVLDCETQRIVAERQFGRSFGYVLVP